MPAWPWAAPADDGPGNPWFSWRYVHDNASDILGHLEHHAGLTARAVLIALIVLYVGSQLLSTLLTPSTTYSYTVKAKDAAGNTSATFSTAVSVMTSKPSPRAHSRICLEVSRSYPPGEVARGVPVPVPAERRRPAAARRPPVRRAAATYCAS